MIPAVTRTLRIAPGSRVPALLAGTIALLASHPTRALEPPLASPASPTPAFQVRQRSDGVWQFLRPSGDPFFSLGVCCVNQGIERDRYDPENPGYAAWRYHPDAERWAGTTLERLQEWGFTTLGAWSDFENLAKSPDHPLVLTPVLHIGSTAGAPWWDMWSAEVTNRMDAVARPQILAVRDDPRLLGYFSDNEMGWWNAALFKMTLEQPPTSQQRQRLLALLRDRYQGAWTNLLQDFQPEGADSFEALDQKGMLYLRSGGQGVAVMRRFLGLMAARYYQLARDIIRAYDPRALILGDRYQSFYYPEVARAAAPYVDVISCNLNAAWNDGQFPRFQLETLHALTGKPILVSEFYLAAMENRSGNRNNHGVFPVTTTQQLRARGVRQTLRHLRALPYVVGADWFQYADEPTHGRDDGENHNFGLVDIHDQPYAELTRTFADLGRALATPPSPHRRRDARDGVPPASRRPLEHFEPRRALEHWDRERGFVPPASEFPLADLYLCWDRDTLYLGVFAQDILEDAYYRDRIVPKPDRMQWIVRAGATGPEVRARLGAGREPLCSDPAVRLTALSGVNLVVRNVAVLELPSRYLGRPRLRAGDAVDLDVELITHCQAYRVHWRGNYTLAR